jgi:hypothetical protein
VINPDFLKLANKKLILGGILALAFLILDFSVLLKLQLNWIKSSAARAQKIQADVDSLERNLAKMEKIKKEQLAKGALKAKQKKLILEQEVSALLKDISALANKNDVRIIQMKPLKEEESAAQEKKGLPARAFPLFINLEMVSDYHHTGSFINALENNEAFLAVDSLKMANQGTDYLKQKVNLVLKTFVKSRD